MQLEEEPVFQEFILNFLELIDSNQMIVPHLNKVYEQLQQETTVQQMLTFLDDDTVAEEMIQGFMKIINRGQNKIDNKIKAVLRKSEFRYQTSITLKAGLEY